MTDTKAAIDELIENVRSFGCMAPYNLLRYGVEKVALVSRREALEEAAMAIREQCPACEGSGYDEKPETIYVTHEMALDAGDRDLEGQIYTQRDGTECEYCGRPMQVVRSLKSPEAK